MSLFSVEHRLPLWQRCFYHRARLFNYCAHCCSISIQPAPRLSPLGWRKNYSPCCSLALLVQICNWPCVFDFLLISSLLSLPLDSTHHFCFMNFTKDFNRCFRLCKMLYEGKALMQRLWHKGRVNHCLSLRSGLKIFISSAGQKKKKTPALLYEGILTCIV